MKILHLVDNFYPRIGGAQYVAGALARAQAARGDAVEIVVTGPRGERPVADSWNEIPVHRLDFRAALEEKNIEKMLSVRNGLKQVRESMRPDITHVHLWGPGAALHMQTNQTAPSPWVVTVHVSLPKPVHGSVDNIGNILRSASAVAAISHYSQQSIMAYTGTASRVRLIYNAARIPHRSFAALPWEPPLLLCLGRMGPEKGFDLAIEAFARVQAQIPEARLVLAGDGPERASLERRTEDLGLADKTSFPGWVAPEEVPEILDRSTIVLVPSRWELFGLVALEAALAGRPVVATKTGGLSEVVLDGHTGIVVPVDEAKAMADAITQLLGNRELATRLGSNAAESARSRFSMERFIAGYDDLYREVLTD
jgi:glycosyltransferase involved in cell wall biosynthesis